MLRKLANIEAMAFKQVEKGSVAIQGSDIEAAVKIVHNEAAAKLPAPAPTLSATPDPYAGIRDMASRAAASFGSITADTSAPKARAELKATVDTIVQALKPMVEELLANSGLMNTTSPDALGAGGSITSPAAGATQPIPSTAESLFENVGDMVAQGLMETFADDIAIGQNARNAQAAGNFPVDSAGTFVRWSPLIGQDLGVSELLSGFPGRVA